MHSVYIEYVWLMLGSSHLTGGAPPHNGENEAEEEEEVGHISEHVCLCVCEKCVETRQSTDVDKITDFTGIIVQNPIRIDGMLWGVLFPFGNSTGFSLNYPLG